MYLEAPGTTVTCNTLTASAPGSVLCPIANTAIPTGIVTLSFSAIDGNGENYSPYPFDVVAATSTTTTTTCTPAPTACNADNCYRALKATLSSGQSFCSNYLTTAVASTASDVVNQCKTSQYRISSACYCLNSATCTSDSCYHAFHASSTAANSFCSSYTAGIPIASTPAFVTSCGSPSSISSACACVTPGAPPHAAKREVRFGRAAEPYLLDMDSVTEVEVIVKRDPGYGGPDGTVTGSTYTPAVVTSTSTIIGSPACEVEEKKLIEA